MKCPKCHNEVWKVEGDEIYCIAKVGLLGICLYHLNEAEKWQYENEKQECLFDVQRRTFNQKIDNTPMYQLIREKLRLLEQDENEETLRQIAEIDLEIKNIVYFAQHQIIYRAKHKVEPEKEPELFS